MKKYFFILIFFLLVYSCTKEDPENFEEENSTSSIYSSNYNQGLYTVDIETGESSKILDYDYFELYDPVYVKEKNLLVIPGHITNSKKGFITINLNTLQIKEFENKDCWKNFVFDSKRKKIYSNNYELGLFEVDIETGESSLLVGYNYWETYKPLYMTEQDMLVIPGATTMEGRGFITIQLENLLITEFENPDCYRGFEKNISGKVYCNNSDKGLYEVNIETGNSTLLLDYNYYETYQPIFIEDKNKLVIPGALSGVTYTKLGFFTIDLNTLSISEFENNDCKKHFVVVN